MYTVRKTAMGKLRTYERELTGLYGEALLRRHYDQARVLFDRRHAVRRAILQAEEWANDDGLAGQMPRQAEITEELARVA